MNFTERLIEHIEGILTIRRVGIRVPPQGMAGRVFFIVSETGKEYVVKYGMDAGGGIAAFALIEKNHIDIPVPQVYASFVFEHVPVLVSERVPFPLLESVSAQDMPKYIPSMVHQLKKLHTIRSRTPGALIGLEKRQSWKEVLLSDFDGTSFDWEEVARRDGVDGELLLLSVQRIREKITKTSFEEKEYSLLHTDFNQRNLFVDPKTFEITGIVDWDSAMFGDPVYDFARIRMQLWHLGLDDVVVQNYYAFMRYTPEQKERETLYWLSRIIQYIVWYSEELNDFNRGRILLHQTYLRSYRW